MSDRDTLARLLFESEHGFGQPPNVWQSLHWQYENRAERVLSSDWLAEHDRQERELAAQYGENRLTVLDPKSDAYREVEAFTDYLLGRKPNVVEPKKHTPSHGAVNFCVECTEAAPSGRFVAWRDCRLSSRAGGES